MHLHTPYITTLEIKGCSLQCSDLDKISRLSNLQHLTYDATGGDSYDSYRQNNFDPDQHRLFAASGFKSPLEGLTNLVSLHIKEEIPNVTPEELQPVSLLSHLSKLALHVATYKRVTRSTKEARVMSSMTSTVYRALSSLPCLSSLAVDVPSVHLSKLTGLQSLSFTKCFHDWHVHRSFTCLTNLTELYVGHGKLALHEVQNLPQLLKATFSIDAVSWDFLRGLTTVRSLTLRRCDMSNAALKCLASMTQLTGLCFSMSYPLNSGIDYDCLDDLSVLNSLASLHGKFVCRYGHESPLELSRWVSELPLLATVAEQQVVLKLHQVPRDSDWMSDFDGSVSCVSGDECENCKSLLGDLEAFEMDSSNSDSDHDSSDHDSSDID